MSQAYPEPHLALQSLLLRKWSQRAQKVTCQRALTPLQFAAAFSWRLPRLLCYASWPSQTGAQLTIGSRSSSTRLAAPSKINRPRPSNMPDAGLHRLRELNFEAGPSWGFWKGEPAPLIIILKKTPLAPISGFLQQPIPPLHPQLGSGNPGPAAISDPFPGAATNSPPLPTSSAAGWSLCRRRRMPAGGRSPRPRQRAEIAAVFAWWGGAAKLALNGGSAALPLLRRSELGFGATSELWAFEHRWFVLRFVRVTVS